MEEIYEAYALKYVERRTRSRADSCLFDGNRAAPHAMDDFLWDVCDQERTNVADTGCRRLPAASIASPGHDDPMVKRMFLLVAGTVSGPTIHRLDAPPTMDIVDLM